MPLPFTILSIVFATQNNPFDTSSYERCYTPHHHLEHKFCNRKITGQYFKL